MMTPNPRALRLALLAALVAGVFSFSASTASAQWADVCMDPNSIPGVFSGFDFSGAPKCEGYCKLINGQCRSLVKDAASCNQKSTKGYWSFFDKADCDTITDPVERKSCHDFVSSSRKDSQNMFNDTRDAALASCDANLATCIDTCNMVVLSN
jgi:hypothetical protein